MVANDKSTTNSADDSIIRVALYSDDRTVRNQVRQALGTKVADDLPVLEIVDFATPKALLAALDEGGFGLGIFDAEAVPEGGMGIAHQIKDELPYAPPVVLLVARTDDAWLAAWSRAEAISPYPIDPIRLPQTVAEVLRADRSGVPTVLSAGPAPEPGVSSRH